MTDSQRLRLQINKLTLRMSTETLTAEERKAAEVEHTDLLGKLVKAQEEESRIVDAAIGDTTETAEVRQLVDRASSEFGTAFDSLINHRNVDGAFAELQAHYGLPQHLIPMRLLQEQRASITGLTDEPSAPQAMRPYIFPQSIAAYMGFDMPTVPYGTPAFPVITTPVSIHSPAAGADAAETTGVIGADALSPGRRQGSLRYNREQAAAFPQLSEGVQAHVQAALASAIDQLALDATAGIGSITEPGDPGAATTFDQYISAFNPDGRYAATPERHQRDCRGQDLRAHARSLPEQPGPQLGVSDLGGGRAQHPRGIRHPGPCGQRPSGVQRQRPDPGEWRHPRVGWCGGRR